MSLLIARDWRSYLLGHCSAQNPPRTASYVRSAGPFSDSSPELVPYMALMPCRECRKQVSTEAPYCPHCGVPRPTQSAIQRSPAAASPSASPKQASDEGNPFFAIAGTVAVVSVLILVAVLSNSGPSGGSSTVAPGASSAEELARLEQEGQARADSIVANVPINSLSKMKAQEISDLHTVVATHADSADSAVIAWKAAALRTAESKRKEEERLAESRRLAAKWNYIRQVDPMTGKVSRRAEIQSENTVSFDFPYAGPQHATLAVRNHASFGRHIILAIQQGQFLCTSYEDCRVRVRFDEGSPERWNAIGSSDGSSNVIAVRDYSRFLQRMRKAKVVRIQAEVYQEGAPTFEFRVGGFNNERYTSGS